MNLSNEVFNSVKDNDFSQSIKLPFTTFELINIKELEEIL